MHKLMLRNERETDYRIVEEITREAFWNLHVPGCDEHYLVHIMRKHPDFIPELSFVAALSGQVVGSIFFIRSYILDEKGVRHDTVTFGPVSVLPALQNQGIGSALIAYAISVAATLGHRAILIHGYPDYYKRFGFRQAKERSISNPEGRYPLAHMVLELYEGALDGRSGRAYESEVYQINQTDAREFDALFAPKERMVTPSQKIFKATASTFL